MLFFLFQLNVLGQVFKNGEEVYFTDVSESTEKLEIRKARSKVAIWGEFRTKKDTLFFKPRISFVAGIDFDLISINTNETLASFSVKESKAPLSYIKSIFPTGDTLPQNTLKFYIKFSNPMQKGVAHRYIKLRNVTTGSIDNRAFHQMKYELWDDKGKTLTIYLDPSRTKSGLVLNRSLGLPLKLDMQYELLVSSEWKDIYGNNLEGFVRSFSVSSSVHQILDENEIKITSVESGIAIDFGRSINFHQLESEVQVLYNEKIQRGNWNVSSNETYFFLVNEPLKAGDYTFNISSELEDISGNTFRKTFESAHMSRYKKPYSIIKSIVIPKNVNKYESNHYMFNNPNFIAKSRIE